MKCNNCGTDNLNDNVYCTKCGTPFGSILCPNCNHTIDEELDNCPKCNFLIKKDHYVCATCNDIVSEEYEFCPHCGQKRVNAIFSLFVFLDILNIFMYGVLFMVGSYFIVTISDFLDYDVYNANEQVAITIFTILVVILFVVFTIEYVRDIKSIIKSKNRSLSYDLLHYKKEGKKLIALTFLLVVSYLVLQLELIMDDGLEFLIASTFSYLLLYTPIKVWMMPWMKKTRFINQNQEEVYQEE